MAHNNRNFMVTVTHIVESYFLKDKNVYVLVRLVL